MAPLGMVDTLGWFSSLEVGLISLIVFLVLSITLVALCARCNKSSGNAYDVSGTQTDGGGEANGTVVVTKSAGTVANDPGDLNWRSHKNMPMSTLERSRAVTT